MKHLGAEFPALFQPRVAPQLWRAVQRDDVPGIAAEVSFYVIFALFPFLLFVSAMVAMLVPNPEVALGRLFTLLHRFLPAATASVFAQFVEGPLRANRPALVSLGIVGILWAGSRGFAAILKALNRVYCARETRHWIRHRALSLGMMISTAVASLGVLVVMTGPDPNSILASWVALPRPLILLLSWFRWPLLWLMVTIVLGWFYTTVPCARRRMQWITPGGLLAAGIWIGSSAGLAAYMDQANLYARIYGAVGDVIIMLLWVYLGSFVMLLGAEINVTAGRLMKGTGQEEAIHSLVPPESIQKRTG